MYEKLLYIIALILGFPAGIYLAWLCKDEIKNWKTRLIMISAICLIIIVALSLFFANYSYKLPIILSLFFIIITCLTIIWKT